MNLLALLPELILSIVGVALVVLIPYVRPEKQVKLGYVALVGILLALLAALQQWDHYGTAFFGMVFQDNFGHFSKALFLLSTGAITATSVSYLDKDRLWRAEYFALLLFATVGMCLMATSADLIMVFLGLETLSIATYVLAGFRRSETKSVESGLKYFILGAFSTGFLLYGVAFIFGATGTTRFLEIARLLGEQSSIPAAVLLGVGLLVVGFGFKIAFVPFHVWTPDVYEGAPTPIMAHLAVASKAAALIAFLRILYQVLPGLLDSWQNTIWVAAALTMMVGNLAALVQVNIKRMLAYSSIAHAGYLLVGLAAHSDRGAQGVLFYLLAYAFMNLGALTIVQLVSRHNEKYVHIRDYVGLGSKHPGMALGLSVFLLSLAGIPLTAGFTGKLFLFSAAIESKMYWLVVIAVIASAIGIYYYLRILVYMYMRESEGEIEAIGLPLMGRVVLVVMAAGTLLLGILPGVFLKYASEAVRF